MTSRCPTIHRVERVNKIARLTVIVTGAIASWCVVALASAALVAAVASIAPMAMAMGGVF